ncbi:MAG: hypothetical protein ACLSU9_11020 [Anaerovoracaceae bacterium]
MIWKPCNLYKLNETNKDILGNPIYEPVKVVETYARYTPWSDEQTALEGRDVTKNEQRFAIPIPFELFPDCSMAEIDGIKQEITGKINLTPRYTVIQVKVYKE